MPSTGLRPEYVLKVCYIRCSGTDSVSCRIALRSERAWEDENMHRPLQIDAHEELQHDSRIKARSSAPLPIASLPLSPLVQTMVNMYVSRIYLLTVLTSNFCSLRPATLADPPWPGIGRPQQLLQSGTTKSSALTRAIVCCPYWKFSARIHSSNMICWSSFSHFCSKYS